HIQLTFYSISCSFDDFFLYNKKNIRARPTSNIKLPTAINNGISVAVFGNVKPDSFALSSALPVMSLLFDFCFLGFSLLGIFLFSFFVAELSEENVMEAFVL